MKAVISGAAYGTADPDKYLLGRGKLLADFYDDTTNLALKAFTDLGNAPSFNLTVDEETLEHKSSRSGVSATDAVVTISKTLQGSFTLDEYGADQLASFLSGTISNATLTGFTWASAAREKTIPGTVAGGWGGRTYELVSDGTVDLSANTRIRRITGTIILGPTNVVSGADYIVTTDYVLDADAGTVHVVDGSTLATDLDAGGPIFVQGLYAGGDAMFQPEQRVNMLQDTTVRAAILFLGENAQTAQKFEVRLHKCKITAEGDGVMIGDDFGGLGFNFVAETSTEAIFASSPVGQITSLGTTHA
jgi:hypothetical protein